MNTTMDIKKGTSFQIKPLSSNGDTVKRFIQIGKVAARTSAQAMTAIAYGDSDTVGIPFRNLDFNTKCENVHDLMACIRIIDSYNDFDADKIVKAMQFTLTLMHFLNEDNPNNGKDLFNFEIGRESSPAFYVGWNNNWNTKRITDWEGIEATEDKPAGKLLYWEEYTADQFKANMQHLSDTIGADEFSIHYGTFYKARFWFD